MGQTLTGLYTHIIFSTKDRAADITSEIAPRVHAYLGGIARECNATAIIINGYVDHVHLLIDSPPSLAVSDLVRTLKSNSSKWIHETWPSARSFAWQTGYAAFSVSRSIVPAVKQYIADQSEHHRRRTFQEEHEVTFDPKYIWT